MTDETTVTTFEPQRGYGFRLAGRRALDWLAEFNPFYLLSAASMLGGLVLLTNTTSWQPAPLGTLLALVGVLQIYELACLGIVALLVRPLGGRRDVYELAGLVAVFAVDASFLMSEIATAAPLVGTLVAAGLLLAGAAKLWLGGLALGVTFRPAAVGFGLAGLAALHAVPPLLTWLDGDDGGVTVTTLYALWWLLPAAALLWRAADHDAWPVGQVALAWLPWASLAAHLGVLHFVYDRPFMAPHAAPLLLAAALLVGRGFWAWALPLAAGWVSIGAGGRFADTLQPGWVGVGAAYLALAWLHGRRHLHHWLAAGVVAAGWAWAGPTWRQVVELAAVIGGRVMTFAWALVPRSRAGWGVAGVGSSFALLACGVAVSLLGRRGKSDAPSVHPAGRMDDVT